MSSEVLKRPAIRDPWATPAPQAPASVLSPQLSRRPVPTQEQAAPQQVAFTRPRPQTTGTEPKPRPAIVDPWASSGPVAAPAPEQPKTGLRRVLDVARSVSPGAMIADSTQTGRDFNSLIGGGVVAGTGRAVEGIERSIHSAFADRPQSRVRFLDDAGSDVTPVAIKQKFAAEDRALALKESQWKPSGFSQALKNTGEAIQNEDISPRMKASMENTQLDGDVFDPSSWSLGQAPSIRGLLGHVAKTGGEMAPIMALGAIPVAGTGLATTAAAGQSASAAYDDAAGYIRNLPPDELAKLPQFQKLVGEGGLSTDEARETLAHRAGSGAMGPAAAVGALSGPILGGAVTKPLGGLAERALGAGMGARVATGAAESLLEGAQEAGETIASRAGANQVAGTDRSTTEGTFGDFALGALASGPSAALHVMAGSEGRSDANPSRPETLTDVIARQQEQGELLALPPPEPVAVDANGNAATWAQQREREALGLTPDVQRVQARNNARPAIRDPWANPELAAPTLPDGSPLPNPNNGPASRTVNMGAQNGAIPTMSGRTWERDLANMTMDAAAAREARQKERELDAIQRESRLPVALEDAEAADRIRAARGADQDVPTAMSVAFQQARERQAQVPFPDAAPGSMADVANTLPSRAVLDSIGSILSQSQAVPSLQSPILDSASESNNSALPRSEVATVTPENGTRQPVDSGELLQNTGIAAAPVAPEKGAISNPPLAASANSARTRPPIRDPWASEVSNTAPEVNTSSAMRSQNAETSTRPASVTAPTNITVEPFNKRLALRGDVAQVRAALKAAGFKGRIWQHPDGFLHVDRKYREQVEQVFGQPAPAVDQTRENPAFAEQNRQIAGSAGAVHLEPGQPPQPVTPAVVAESAQAVQRAPNVTMPQAKKTLLGQIDAALSSANPDAWPDIEGRQMNRPGARQAAEAERDRITKAAGYVTFDVPGDGTFRVVNNRSRLEAFRSQVERQFKNTSLPTPKLPSLKASDAERARIMSEAEQVDDALFSRASVVQGQPTGKGLPVANVERIAQDFMRRYRGNIPLQVRVGATVNDLYGVGADQRDEFRSFKGAYHPRRGVLTLAAAGLSSRTDVETTLRHEVLGHYGLNTLEPADKRAVLDAILTSRNRRDLAPVWAQIDAAYSDMPENIRAEEVFAELASRDQSTLGEWWNRVLALLAKGLRKVGLLRDGTTRAELHDLARRIAQGIRSGEREQRTFPQNDQSQFSRDARKTPSGVGTLSEQELEVLRQLGLLSQDEEADLSGQPRRDDEGQRDARGFRITTARDADAFLSAFPEAARYGGSEAASRAVPKLLERVRELSERAVADLGGDANGRLQRSDRIGPFTGSSTTARIKNLGTPQESLVVQVYGKEQIAAGLDEEPALTWTVNLRTGELDVNGPNPERATFREFQKRGWADHARGADGQIAQDWTALTNPDGSAALPLTQIMPMLADVHARYRALRKEDRVGLHWSRMTGATGGIAGRESAVFFSRALPPRLNDTQRTALSKIGSFATPESLPKRARRVLGELRRELVQGVFDQFQPFKALDQEAYMQARLSRGTDGALEGLFLHGPPILRDGALDVKPDGQGLRGVLADLQGEHDLFLAWVAGHRAAQLKFEGREHLFSGKEVQALQALDQGTMPDGSPRAAAYRKALAGYNRYQKAVLDIGEKAGLYSADSRRKWESEFYIPFFRDFDAEHNEPSPFRETGTQKVIQQLEGGAQPLGDLLTNVLENHSRILTASMRNLAANKALAAAEKANLAVKVETGSKDTHRVMRKGEAVHFRVEDPLLVDALTMLHFNGDTNKAMQVLGSFKRVLSFSVTVSPGFRIRNLLRDSISALAVADAGWNPLRNIATGWKASGQGTDTFQRLLAGGGAVRFGALNDGAQSVTARRLIATGVKPEHILDTPAKAKRALQAGWQWWQAMGDRAETVNRAVIYDRAIKGGKNHLEASYEARDLLDFTMGGKWAAVRFLAQTVPFLNARLQGMYKLGRGAKANPARFGAVVGAVALASAVSYLLQRDDEEYKALPDWARDSYWCINFGGTMLFIPKPFEVGAMGTVIERGTELMLGGDDYRAKDFANTLTSVAVDQLAMNPIPQAVRPLLEVAFNRDMFRNRPIDSMGQERLPAEDRHTARTSAPAVLAGQALHVSPNKLEHLTRGYFGWLGLQALNVTDLLVRPMTNLPSSPARDAHSVANWPVVGEFVKDAGAVSSKYVDRFYEMQRRNDELYAAYSAARSAGDVERAMELEDTDAVRFRKAHNLAKRQMQDVNRRIRMATADPSLTASEKGELLRNFQEVRHRIAEYTDQMARAR